MTILQHGKQQRDVLLALMLQSWVVARASGTRHPLTGIYAPTIKCYCRIIKLSEPREIRYKDRFDKLSKNFKRFFGDLTNAQIEMLETHSHETLNDSRVRLHNRTLRQKVFVRFMKSQPNEAELNAYLNKLLIRGHEIINPNYEDFSQASISRFKILLIKMLAISSDKQRNVMINKLRSYAREFNTISR